MKVIKLADHYYLEEQKQEIAKVEASIRDALTVTPNHERYVDELRRVADDVTFHQNLKAKAFMNVVDLVGFDSSNDPVLVLACGKLKRKQVSEIAQRDHGILRAS